MPTSLPCAIITVRKQLDQPHHVMELLYNITYLLRWIWSMSFPILLFLLFISFSMFRKSLFSTRISTNTGNQAWWVMWKMYLSKYELVKEILGLKKEQKKPKTIRRRRQFVDTTQVREGKKNGAGSE